MATPSGPSSGLAPSNWFSRNWKWVVSLGLLAAALLLAAFVAGIFLLVETSFQHSWAYSQALARARANPQVAAKIGQPIEPGWFCGGSINVSGPSGHADISIPIRGPKGKGTAYVVASKSAGEWKLQTLQVEIEGEGSRIDLMEPEAAPRDP